MLQPSKAFSKKKVEMEVSDPSWKAEVTADVIHLSVKTAR